MSVASDWAVAAGTVDAAVDALEASAPPSMDGPNGVVLRVSRSGGLAWSGSAGSDEFTAVEALALAAWIVATFGD